MSDENKSQLISDVVMKNDGYSWVYHALESVLLTIFLLCVFSLLLYFLSRYLRKRDKEPIFDNVRIIHGKRISRRSTAIIIEWKNYQYLIVESSHGVTLIDRSGESSDN